jgi:exodeoxyribonuclease VII large subunit
VDGWRSLPFDDAPTPGPARGPLTVSELTALLKRHIEGRFASVVVEGEISNCKSWSSGHIYFTLKDDYAQLQAVLFRTQARLLKFKLEDGMQVVARGRLSVYEVKGGYQLVADAVEPTGLGALQAAFDQLKKKLQAEGLFDAARKRPLPALPRRIGVVTSADGAALRDILRILIARHPSARIVVRPARVQGDDAATDVIRALRAIVKVPELDVVIVGRGGGSAEDLQAFNDERLARAIVACPVPVISAVGHEVDFTIADFVADLRAATPSNAAELVVERADHVCGRIDRATDRLHRALERAVDRRDQQADRLALRLRQWPVRIALRQRDADELDARLRQAARAAVARGRTRTDTLHLRLARRDLRRLAAELAARTTRADSRLAAAMLEQRHAAERRAATLAARLDALSPLAVLSRGYALCWNDARTSIIRSPRQVGAGDRVHVRVADGELDCRVEDARELPRQSSQVPT